MTIKYDEAAMHQDPAWQKYGMAEERDAYADMDLFQAQTGSKGTSCSPSRVVWEGQYDEGGSSSQV